MKNMQNGIKAVLAVLCALVLILGIAYLQARGNVAALTKNVQELSSTVESKDQEIEAISAVAAKNAAEIEALNAAAADRTAELEALTAADAEKAAQIETLSADAAEKAAQIETLSADAAEKAAQIETLSADAEKKDARMKDLSDEAAEKAAQIETLTDTAEKQSAEIQTLNAGIAEKDSQIEALSAQLAALPKEDLSTVAEGRYANTKRFLLRLEENDLPYEVSENGEKDTVIINLRTDSDVGTDLGYTLRVAFSPDNESATFFIWNLVDYNAADTGFVRALCDRLNADWRWVTFYTDQSDNSVNCSCDCALTDSPEAGEILWNTTVHINTVLGLITDELLPFAL